MNQEQIEQGKKLIKSLYQPPPNSHKGQNGKVMVIGGSHLFHAASLWALKVVSRIVDMTFYSSVPENNEIVQKSKEEFHDGIVVRRDQIESYINEADCILIGPGMERVEGDLSAVKYTLKDLSEAKDIENEGILTYHMTKYLLTKYPNKRWVIDAGSLQMTEPEWIPKAAIVTPHIKEFEKLFSIPSTSGESPSTSLRATPEVSLSLLVKAKAEKYGCTILLKGVTDVICNKEKCTLIKGGNAGMTKGGTGDVLAGLVAGFYAKNEAFKSAVTASFLNKLAGEKLFEKVGYMFNASDLVEEIPIVYKSCLEQ